MPNAAIARRAGRRVHYRCPMVIWTSPGGSMQVPDSSSVRMPIAWVALPVVRVMRAGWWNAASWQESRCRNFGVRTGHALGVTTR